MRRSLWPRLAQPAMIKADRLPSAFPYGCYTDPLIELRFKVADQAMGATTVEVTTSRPIDRREIDPKATTYI